VRAALFENTVLLVAQHMAQFELTGREPPPMAQRDPAWGVYDIFPTADGRLFIAAATDRQWQSFCRCMNAPQLLADAQLETNAGRYARRLDLLPAIATLTRTVSTQVLVERLEAAGLPFAPINTPAQLLDDRHLREGGGLLDVATPDMRRLSVPALPLELDGKKLGVRRQPPQLGGDTTELLLELGLSKAEIDGLVERGIVNRYVDTVGA
jgi:crotonobetainyl-CoA:carnitine CoA-transferase CaiB-like acyl-CoA transferase